MCSVIFPASICFHSYRKRKEEIFLSCSQHLWPLLGCPRSPTAGGIPPTPILSGHFFGAISCRLQAGGHIWDETLRKSTLTFIIYSHLPQSWAAGLRALRVQFLPELGLGPGWRGRAAPQSAGAHGPLQRAGSEGHTTTGDVTVPQAPGDWLVFSERKLAFSLAWLSILKFRFQNMGRNYNPQKSERISGKTRQDAY